MEEKLQLIYMGAAALLFVAAMIGWISVEQDLNQSLASIEQQFNEERVIIRTGGY